MSVLEGHTAGQIPSMHKRNATYRSFCYRVLPVSIGLPDLPSGQTAFEWVHTATDGNTSHNGTRPHESLATLLKNPGGTSHGRTGTTQRKRQRKEQPEARAEEPEEDVLRRKMREKAVIRSFRVRMRPTPAQRKELVRWFKAARWGYNTTVQAVKNGSVKLQGDHTCTQVVRQHPIPEEFAGIHSTICRNGMRMAVRSFTTNLAKQRKSKHKKTFVVKKINGRKVQTEVVLLNGVQMRNDKIKDKGPIKAIRSVAREPSRRRRHAELLFGTSMEQHGAVRIIDSAKVIDRLVNDGLLKHEGKIQWNHHRTQNCHACLHSSDRNHFYLIVCWPVNIPEPRQGERVVSLDPGARHFQVWYDPEKGSFDCKSIYKTLLHQWRASSRS